jgi:hypothetical protein
VRERSLFPLDGDSQTNLFARAGAA